MSEPAGTGPSLMDEFVDRYKPDVELFAREVLGIGEDVFMVVKDGERAGQRIQVAGLWPNQVELLQAYQAARNGKPGAKRRISKRSGHRVGKTTALAIIIWHHLLFYFRQKTVCTAPTTKQLFDALYAETVTFYKQLPKPLQALFEVKSEEIVLISAPKESFASFRTSSAEKPEALAGVHSEYVLLIIDEASGVAEVIFESADGSMAGPNAITILTGNPVRTSGTFYDSHMKPELEGLWYRIHTSSRNHPNVSPDFVTAAAAKYGVDSDQFRVRVEGDFPKGEASTVIPFELAEAALTRDVKPAPVRPIWGLDVGVDNDPAALCQRRGNVLDCPTEEFHGADGDPMKVVGWVKGKWDTTLPSQRPSEINVDSIGIGLGVAYRLMELGLPARAVNVSESPAMKQQYMRLRDELWWSAREWFQTRTCNVCGDRDLVDELVRPTYKSSDLGKIKVEGKKETKKRTKTRSPNRADSLILTFASEAVTASANSHTHTGWKEPLKREIKGIV